MARTVVTKIIDDIDGTGGAEEVRFAYDGTEYAIDLSAGNREAFEKALQPYVAAARALTRPRRSRAAGKPSTTRRDLRAVREWAKSRGIEVSDRGRVPTSILDQYDAEKS